MNDFTIFCSLLHKISKIKSIYNVKEMIFFLAYTTIYLPVLGFAVAKKKLFKLFVWWYVVS